MNERPEEEYDEEEDLDSGEDVDQAIREFDHVRRRSPPKGSGDPAWRKLERLREDKHTAELMSDFDDYDIEPLPAGKRPAKGSAKR